MILDDLLHQHAARQPAKAAVRTVERSITYDELDRSVGCLAGLLLDRGMRRGDRIAMHWSNSIETVQLLLATFRAGLIAVPINVRLKPPEIAYILEHSEARVCFSEPDLAGLTKQAQLEGYPEVVSEFPALTNCSAKLPEVDPDQPALILYTSGTTARPKGVTHTHRTLFESARMLTLDPIGPEDTVLTITQLAHASALHISLLPALHQGATAVLLRAFVPAAALDAIEQFRCTYTVGLPAMLQFVVEEQVRRPRNLSTMRNVVAGGDTVPAPLLQRGLELFGTDVREIYGMTEAAPITLNPQGAVRTGSIGPAVADVSIRLIDLDGREVEPGETGEIVVRGPANCIGYWNDTEATARLFEGGWLRTGDLASRDADDYYWFKGRLKQLIVRGGSNISPQEVEEALYQHPAVLEAGVTGASDLVYGQVPVAFVTLREDRRPTEDDLLAHARTLLADYKMPDRILFVEQLPKGLTGKVDRRRLSDILIADPSLLEKRVVARI